MYINYNNIFTFIDINECITGNTNCDTSPRAYCNNTLGSYTCHCSAGYAGDGLNCIGLLSGSFH